MAGLVGHTGGLTNPRPWRGRCRAGYFSTSGPPLPRKRAPLQKRLADGSQIEGDTTLKMLGFVFGRRPNSDEHVRHIKKKFYAKLCLFDT